MPGSATDYLETRVLQHFLRIAVIPQPAGLYLALCTTPPTDTAQGAEVAGGAYIRQSCVFAMTAQPGAAGNTATVEYPIATGAWGTISHLEIWDAITAGNRMWYGPLVDPADGVTPITRDIGVGDILRLPAGAVVVTAD